MRTNNISFKNLSIKHLIKPRLKNIYFNISRDLEIIVKSPKISSSYLFELLEKKELWIRKQLYKLENNQIPRIVLTEEVLLFDKIIKIDEEEVKELRLMLKRAKNNSNENIAKKYDLFYKNYAQKYITQRVEYFATFMNLEYSQIKFRKMKSRWGSCSSKKVLTFNTELLKLKKELIDYVVVHELAHLKHMNHSKKFHSFVDDNLENAYLYKKELRTIRLPIV